MRLSFVLPKICTRKEVSALYCLAFRQEPSPLVLPDRSVQLSKLTGGF